jgi:Gram-negative bacterial TonB protein C-terminal
MHKRTPFILLMGFLLSAQMGFAQESPVKSPTQKNDALLAESKPPPEIWQPVAIREGNFSIIFPVGIKREASRSRFKMQDGDGIETRFAVPLASGNYQTAFTFLSDNLATPQAIRQRFEALLKNLKTNPKLNWLSGGEIEYRGNPGIELKVQVIESKTIIWSRQYFAFGCLYELTVRYMAQEPELKEPQLFLDSFNLLGPPIQRPTLTASTQDALPDFTPLAQNIYYVSPETLRAQAIEKPEPKPETERKVPAISVTLLLTVSPEGKVVQADLQDGFPGLYNIDVLKAVKKWTFKPFLLNGKPVKVQGRLTFKFGDAVSPKLN